MTTTAWVALVVAVAITGLFSAKLTTRVVAQVVAQNVTVPYAITYDNVLTDPAGRTQDLGSHVDEQRRNGDRSQLWPLLDGKTKRIIEFVAAGLTVSASDANANISTLGKGVSRVLPPNDTCLAGHRPGTELSKESILGYTVTHYHTPAHRNLQIHKLPIHG